MVSEAARDILTDNDDGVLTTTFHRTGRTNEFTLAMYEELVLLLGAADRDPAVRVVVFTGAQDAFTSGNDLHDFMQDPPKGEDSAVFRFLMALVDFEKPLICAVNGIAIGIGST